MLPDDLYSNYTGPFGVPLAMDTTSLSSYNPVPPAVYSSNTDMMYNTIFKQLLATTFGGLTDEEIRTACIAYYPERFI